MIYCNTNEDDVLLANTFVVIMTVSLDFTIPKFPTSFLSTWECKFAKRDIQCFTLESFVF